MLKMYAGTCMPGFELKLESVTWVEKNKVFDKPDKFRKFTFKFHILFFLWRPHEYVFFFLKFGMLTMKAICT
jgi:hypothetical protein